MSGKNNIDKLVSDKFAAQQLPVNEAHWASTQSFISAQRRKRRRVLAFWLVGLLFISSIGYLALDGIQNSGSSEIVLNENENAVTGTQKPNETQSTPPKQAVSNSEAASSQTKRNPGNSEAPIHISGSSRVSLIATLSDSNFIDTTEAPLASAETLSTDKLPDSTKLALSLSLSISAGRDSSEQSTPEDTKTEEGNGSQHTTSPSSVVSSTMVVESDATKEPDLPISDVTSGITIFNGDTNDSLDVKTQDIVSADTASKKLTVQDTVGPADGVAAVDKFRRFTDVPVSNVSDDKDTVLPVDSSFLLRDSSAPVLLTENTDSLFLLEDSFLREEKRSYKGLFLMPYFGPSLSFKNLSGSDKNLLEKRENEEKDPITADLGIMARYGFSNGMYFGTGLNYFKMGENARYSPFEVVNEKTVPHTFFTYQDASYFEYTDWDTAYLPFEQKVYTAYRWVTKLDSTPVVGEKTVFDTLLIPERVVNNRFSYVELPLLVGYQMPLGKWCLGADIGTELNFLVQTQGNYPDLETGEYPMLTTSEYRRLTYTFLSNLSIGRELGKHWILYGNLRLRNQLTSPQKSNEVIQAKYKSVGLQFKLNYRF